MARQCRVHTRSAFAKWEDELQDYEYKPESLSDEKSHVGLQTPVGNENKFAYAEPGTGSDRGPVMQAIAKVPGMNKMSIFHDKWAFESKMEPFATKATIIPAILITYTGLGTQLYGDIVDLNTAAGKPDALGGAKLPIDTGGAIPSNAQAKERDSSNVENISIVRELLQNYDEKLEKKIKRVKDNKGLELLSSSIVKPKPGYEWKEPNDSLSFKVHKVEGLAITEEGNLYPAPGFELVAPGDPVNLTVKRSEGIKVFRDGRLAPSTGWEWVNSEDENNFDVRLIQPAK